MANGFAEHRVNDTPLATTPHSISTGVGLLDAFRGGHTACEVDAIGGDTGAEIDDALRSARTPRALTDPRVAGRADPGGPASPLHQPQA